VTSMHEEGALTEGERAELERLRAEEATLRSQVPGGSKPNEGRMAVAGRPARQRWRTIVRVLSYTIAAEFGDMRLHRVARQVQPLADRPMTVAREGLC
jgi:hypothetical protein